MLITSRAEARSIVDRSAGTLWYDRPADRWFEALPIGNGRLGGMVYGGTRTERIRLSESTAWSGAASTTDISPTALRELPTIRGLLFAGRYAEAQELAGEHLPGRMTSFGTNLPLPEVRLDFTEHRVDRYRRTLDLDSTVVTVEYDRDGAGVSREAFASNPHGVIAVRITTDDTNGVSFSLTLDNVVLPGSTTATETGVAFSGHAFESLHSNGREGVAVEIRAHVAAENGTVRSTGDSFEVANADSARLLIAVGTDWAGATAGRAHVGPRLLQMDGCPRLCPRHRPARLWQPACDVRLRHLLPLRPPCRPVPAAGSAGRVDTLRMRAG